MRTPGFLPRAQVAIGIGYLAIFVGFSMWARFDVPYRDDWDWILSLLTGPGGIVGLLLPHNEHVIPLARLLMRAQFALGGLHGHLIQYVALGCHLALVWVFWREVRRRWPESPDERWTVGGVLLVCLAFTQQLQSIVFAAAVLFPLVQLWTTMAIAAWLNADEARRSGSPRGRFWWWCAVACVGGAVASTTSGIVVPVVLALMAFLRGHRSREALAWAGITIALSLAYVGWVGLGDAAVGSGQVEPWAPPGVGAMLAYALAVLSVGVSYVHATAAVVVGAVVLGAVAWALGIALRHRATLARIEMFAVAQMLFALACIAMVTPGRAQFGVAQAGQSRYATFVVCLLGALVMFVASRATRHSGYPPISRFRVVAQGAGVALSLALLVPNVYVGLLWRAKADNLNSASIALRSGVADPAWLTTLHPLPAIITRVVTVMASRGMPVEDPLLHTRVVGIPTIECSGGGALLRRSAEHGMTMSGMWSRALAFGVVVDRTGTVVGLTQPSPWVAEPAPTPQQVHHAVVRKWREWSGPTADRAWQGFAQPGAGPPYRWVGGAQQEEWTCTSLLPVTASIHATLESVALESGGALRVGGWAFACGEAITSKALVVDGVPVAGARMQSGLARPDVDATFNATCAPAEPPGIVAIATWESLPPGPHTARLRVVSTSGAVGESAPVTFVIPAGAAR